MKLLLNGGGCGEQTIIAIQKLNKIIDHDKPILYIPLAMDENTHPYDGCLEWIKKELALVDVPRIDMTRNFEELASKNYNDYSCLFIGGGNTYKLLKGLKKSGAFDKIKEYILNDGIIFGSSAGAVIFGLDIDIISSMDQNIVNLTDTAGFNIIDGISLFPHYTNAKSKLTDEENDERHNKFTNSIIEFSNTIGPVIAYPEEDTIFIDGNNIYMLGTRPYYIFKFGTSKKIEIINNNINIYK